jgi:hypothetical protein
MRRKVAGSGAPTAADEATNQAFELFRINSIAPIEVPTELAVETYDRRRWIVQRYAQSCRDGFQNITWLGSILIPVRASNLNSAEVGRNVLMSLDLELVASAKA